MTDKKKKTAAQPLTPEQVQHLRMELAARVLEQQQAQERAEKYGKSLSKMSHKQLRGELKRTVRRNLSKEGHGAGMELCMGIILSTVFENTKTKENPKGRVGCYPV